MAQRNSSGRGATATKDQTTGTASIRESEIARLKADDIRSQLKERGISGISAMRKDDLVKSLVKTLRAESRAAGRAGGKATVTGGKAVAPAGGAKKSTSAARKGIPAKAGSRSTGGGSRSLKYAQRISSTDERPDRPGRSLVTTNHDVIRRWAQDRGAKPATIEGTEREGRAGVLTFDFPGWREGGKLRQITWDQWFQTFDLRRLNFIYQEQKTDGVQSNFFRTESPSREDG